MGLGEIIITFITELLIFFLLIVFTFGLYNYLLVMFTIKFLVFLNILTIGFIYLSYVFGFKRNDIRIVVLLLVLVILILFIVGQVVPVEYIFSERYLAYIEKGIYY